MENDPCVLKADVVDTGVLVTFADGSVVLFSASMLHAHLHLGKLIDQDSDKNQGNEEGL